MIAHIVDVIGFIFAILFTRKDTADVGLSAGTWAEACGIGKESFEKLDRHDFPPFEENGRGGEHAYIFKAFHMGEIALAEGHKEAYLLTWYIKGKRLDFLMVEKTISFRPTSQSIFTFMLMAGLTQCVFPIYGPKPRRFISGKLVAKDSRGHRRYSQGYQWCR